jgi:hypothetical protein
MRISSASTTNVYGRPRAILTISFTDALLDQSRAGRRAAKLAPRALSSAEKIFQSICSQQFMSGITFGNIAAAANFAYLLGDNLLLRSEGAKTLMLYPIARLRA